MKKKTHEEYVTELSIKNPNVEVVDKYIDIMTPIQHKCKIDGFVWMGRPNDILRGHGCPKCGVICRSDKITKNHNQYIQDLVLINPNIEVVEQYMTSKTPIIHRCKICGYQWKTKPNTVLCGRGCPKCSGVVKRSHENYVQDIQKNNPNIEVVDCYLNRRTKILHRCKKCGYEWLVTPSDILSGHGCPKCAGVVLKTHKQYVTEVSNKTNGIDVLGQYVNRSTQILHKCRICGNEWSVSPNNILSGYGCPRCSQSHGEKDIMKWLDDNNINYIVQYRFDDCRDKKPLPFDFYLPDYNTCIEYDGEQHFQPVDFSGKDKQRALDQFSLIQLHDKLKNMYCEQNNIYLFRISYKQNIEEELKKFLLI